MRKLEVCNYCGRFLEKEPIIFNKRKFCSEKCRKDYGKKEEKTISNKKSRK